MGPRALVFWGLAAAASTAAAIVTSLQATDRIADAARLEAPVFAGLVAAPETAAHISVSQAGRSFEVVLDDGAWIVPDRHGYAADIETVRGLVTGLSGLRFAAPRTALPERFARLEVDDPGEGSEAQRVTVAAADGAVLADAIIGKRSAVISGTQRGTYLRLPDGEHAWLASGTVDVATNVVDWLDTGLDSIGRGALRSLVVAPAAGTGFTVGRLEATDDLTLMEPVPEGRSADADAIRRLVGAFDALRFEDVRPSTEIAWPDALTRVTATSFDDETITVELATVDDATWLRFGADAAWAYVLPQFQLDRMNVTLEDLLQAPEAS